MKVGEFFESLGNAKNKISDGFSTNINQFTEFFLNLELWQIAGLIFIIGSSLIVYYSKPPTSK